MKVGNVVDGLAVVDVKRINKMNLIQFTKAVSEYIEQGYKLDVHSSRQVGALQLMVDMYKLESNVSGSVDSTGEAIPVGDSSTEDVVKEPNETTLEAVQESTEKLEAIEPVETVTEDTLVDVKEAVEETEEEEKDGADVEQTPPVKKATRTKKQTT